MIIIKYEGIFIFEEKGSIERERAVGLLVVIGSWDDIELLKMIFNKTNISLRISCY